MSQEKIAELEQQLVTANAAVATLTLANTALTLANATLKTEAAEADGRARRLKRNNRNSESALMDQLSAAQNRRG